MKSIEVKATTGRIHIIYLKHIISISESGDPDESVIKVSSGLDLRVEITLAQLADQIDKISQGLPY